MVRPRTFDEERALDAAMHTFWEKGYEATSTQDLCEATGLGRSSIYNTFKSKHDLFERALAHYIDTMTTAQLAVLEDTRHCAADRIRDLFA
ncbi:TetR/AcrR family transcriptional regulator, partial [Streptomyces sp. TRM76130]|nr:TetR/AcrR family transcriptional regulator [Streptomyces sp. TRM76130]